LGARNGDRTRWLPATGNDSDEVRVARIGGREPGGEPTGNGVVARPPDRLDPEAVGDEDVAQRRQREDVDVLPRFPRQRLPGVQRVRISDRSPGRDVRERERLVAKGEGDDVVPAREILRADDGAAARAKHAADLLDEVVETLDV